MKITKAMIRKSKTDCRKAPYLSNTGAPFGSVPKVIARSLKFTPPINNPSGGMMTSPTSEETILPNAAPTMTPTARSITLPRIGEFFELRCKAHGRSPRYLMV